MMDRKPGNNPSLPTTAPPPEMAIGGTSNDRFISSKEARELKTDTEAQGKVNDLKTTNESDKVEIQKEVDVLLRLKAKYRVLTGVDATPVCESHSEEQNGEIKENRLQNASHGLPVTREENFSEWYTQVIQKAEMIEYYDVSGCYIMRPWSYGMWERIHAWLDRDIQKLGVENYYFPMFVSQQALQTEKNHIAEHDSVNDAEKCELCTMTGNTPWVCVYGAPHVVWVTKSGQSELAEPIAIRLTSETLMYPTFAKWIKSHRDLPILLNQWCNVVRWESHPQPFLRAREFLWQEGHTAHATRDESVEFVYSMLEIYAKLYEKQLAIPVVRGRKTKKEQFTASTFTTTVEAFVAGSGRGIQGATSHYLGQNFSKMFDIVFEDPETSEKRFVHQASWGLTTRTIGVVCMVHGDNVGLVLPPNVANLQVIIVPCGITASSTDDDRNTLQAACEEMKMMLMDADIRVKGDYRDNYSPRWKFNHWELKGVPIRIELGPRDIKNKQLVVVRRDTMEKVTISHDGIVGKIANLLETIQADMYDKAKKDLDDHIVVVQSWNDFCDSLQNKKIIMAPFCGDIPCEENIKKDSTKDVVVEEGALAMGAKSLCIPFKQPREIKDGMKCVHPDCNKKPQYYTLFGRSY